MQSNYPDPLHEFNRTVADAMAAHEALRSSPEWARAESRLWQISADYAGAVRSAFIFATRHPNWKQQLFWIGTDDFTSSALGVAVLGAAGIHNPARRELRFMLESSVKYLYVDQQLARHTPMAIRRAFLDAKVKASGIDSIEHLELGGLVDETTLVAATWQLWGELSEYVHLSEWQLAEHLDAIGRGSYRGFETAADLDVFTDLLRRTYDVLLMFVFAALGRESTSDLFDVLSSRPQWTFMETRFTSGVAVACERS